MTANVAVEGQQAKRFTCSTAVESMKLVGAVKYRSSYMKGIWCGERLAAILVSAL